MEKIKKMKKIRVQEKECPCCGHEMEYWIENNCPKCDHIVAFLVTEEKFELLDDLSHYNY